MKTTLTDISKTEKEAKVIFPAADFDKIIQSVENEAVKEVELKGFRKGQAPKDMALQSIDRQKILIEAADRVLKDIYPKILKEHNLEPIGLPQVEILKLADKNDFECKIKIALLPEIDVPDYKSIASEVQKQQVTIEDKEIDNAFKQLQENQDKLTKEQLENISFDAPEALKQIIRTDLHNQKEFVEKQRVRNDVLKKIAEKAQFSVPEVLINSELQRTIQDVKNNVTNVLKITFEDYLKKIKKTEKELEESLKKDIELRIKRILLLKEIQKKEDIKVDDAEVTKQAKLMGDQGVDIETLKEYLRERMEQEKTLEFLETLTSKILKP